MEGASGIEMLGSENSCAPGMQELNWINSATENPSPVRADFEKCILPVEDGTVKGLLYNF